MPARYSDDDDDAADDFDDYPDDEIPTLPCPYCGEDICEDAERCPYCENYISQEDAPPRGKPWWLVLGVIVCLGIVYWWIFH